MVNEIEPSSFLKTVHSVSLKSLRSCAQIPYLSSVVEIIAAFTIGVALLKFIYRYIRYIFNVNDELINQTIRIQFGSALTIALELLLAADILATAIAPTWDDIGKLAAIAILRTGLNYFLEKELKSNEKTSARAIVQQQEKA
jgi:uncharacterized membrane protein